MLIASLAAAPALSFAQQMTPPTNGGTTAPAASIHDAQGNRTATQTQQPSRNGSRYDGDSSGYGAPATGSSQSSVTRFAGKHSQLFSH